MGLAKRKTATEPTVNEVVEAKKREIAAAKGEEPPVTPEVQALREETVADLARAAEEEVRSGKVAPEMEDIIEDDMRTEAEIQKEKDEELIRELASILKVPKTRDSVLTFSMYTIGQMRRYFLLDVDGTAYRKGWAYYKSQRGDDPVGYIDMVIHIMDHEIPRLHRAVDWAPLN